MGLPPEQRIESATIRNDNTAITLSARALRRSGQWSRWRRDKPSDGIADPLYAKAVVLTDGITEAINKQGELFNTPRLVNILEQSTGLCPQEILDRVLNAVFEWLGPLPQSDDLPLFILRRLPQEGEP